MKIAKKILRYSLWFLLLCILYVVITLIHGTITDFQPEEKISLQTDGNASASSSLDRDSLTFMIWNLGYGSDGAESDFFYDNDYFFFSHGKMVRAPKELSLKNLEGFKKVIAGNPSDFYLIQEVDVDARRSYHINQYEELLKTLNGYTATYAVNFKSPRVPLPLCEPFNPIGQVDAGLGTYTRYKSKNTVRYQYPGSFAWPEKIFNLDRCMSVQRFDAPNGKELLVINSHNSAYDKGGVMKKLEMDYTKNFLLEEYAKGNYIVMGADWNQCPPGFKFNQFMSPQDSSYTQTNIPVDFMPEGWVWSFDPTVPTNRKLADKYVKGKTFVTLIDFFVSSPNVEVLAVKGVDTDFQYSDHQPVRLSVRLKK